MLTRLATYLSYLFEPFVILLVTWILVISSLDAPLAQKLVWFLNMIIFSGFAPVAILLYERKTGKISDWFMTNRLERRDVHIAWVAGSLLLTIIFTLMAAPRILAALALAQFLVSLVIAFVTRFWKISVHMVGVTLFVLVLLLVYSSTWLWLALLLPIVAWSRVSLGHHTLTQVTVGTLVTIAIVYFAFNLYGLASF